METKANYLIVGSFVLALAAGLFLFVIWLTKVEVNQQFTPYRIYFTGSITGLQNGSAVRYRGIPVGSVIRIGINQENVEEIEVTIEVNSDTPVREDTEASIEVQGLTGVAYIQLSGGTQGAPALKPKPGKKYANIRSRKSSLERVFSSAPELVDRINELISRATILLDDHNQQAIADTLDNVRTLTGAFAAKGDEISTGIDDGVATLKAMRQTAADLDVLAVDMNKNMKTTLGSVKSLADNANARTTEIGRQLNETAQSMNRLSSELEAVVKENRRPIRDFTGQGLYQLSQLLTEMRTMVVAVTRLTNKIEADPARFLFGDQQQGVPAR